MRSGELRLDPSFLRQQFFHFCLLAGTQGMVATAQLWSTFREWKNYQAMLLTLPTGVAGPPFAWPWLEIGVAFFSLIAMAVGVAMARHRWKQMHFKGFEVLPTTRDIS